MSENSNRNRPVFRPQPDSQMESASEREEATPRVEEALEESRPAPAPVSAEKPRGKEIEEPPATVPPAGRSAFAKTGRDTRGRTRSLPEPATEKRYRPGEERREREGATRGAAPGSSGDTVPAMPAVDYDPSRGKTGGRGPGAGPGNRPPQRPGARPTQLPKPRRHVGGSPGRFGFFGFVFGLIGLIIRMLIVTVLVGGIVGVASYVIIQWYVKTPPETVPNVRGMKVQLAFEALSDKGFAMARDRAEPSALVAPGEVIEQRPAPGTKTKKGTTVRLVVSSGKSNFVVPDVRGETRDSAINKIKGAQLEVGNITFLPDEKVPADTVITQNPEPNKGLDAAAKVDLLISSGTAGQPLSMPDVTNTTVADARAKLNRLGFNTILTDPAGAPENSLVTAQSPLVGKLVRQADQVTLTVKR